LQFTDPTPQDLPAELAEPLPAAPPPPPPPDPRAENPVWNLWDVLLITGVSVAALIVAQVVVLIVAYFLPQSHHASIPTLAKNTLLLVPAQVLGYLLIVGFMAFLLWTKYRSGFAKAIRWNAPPARSAAAALLAGGGLGLVSLVFSASVQKWVPKSLPIDEMFQSTASAYMLAAFAVLVAPVVEEIFFRGFLYPALARKTGEQVATVYPAHARKTGQVVAIVLTSLAFALIHEGQLAHAWLPLLWLSVVGAVLTTVRAATKSVATTVLIHMGYNGVLMLLDYIYTHGFREFQHS
jgi:membrane protease YdiL (CAAX protease family)